MKRDLGRWVSAGCLALAMLQQGCGALPPQDARLYPPPAGGQLPPWPAAPAAAEGQQALLPAAYRGDSPLPAAAGGGRAGKTDDPDGGELPMPRKAPDPRELPMPRVLPGHPGQPSLLAGMEELTPEAVVAGVLARNPSLAEMVAAWKAAAARYPQVTSLDDPMLGVQAAPVAWFARDVEGGTRVEVSQRYPWHGKLETRGENALAQAGAALYDVKDMELQLAESARRAFYDYYLVDRALAVNRENLRLLREFKKNAETRYTAGTASQQDVLQAEVEIGRAQERQVMLRRLRPVTVARINTLLHLPPDSPLPPAPEKLELGDALPEAGLLRAWALHYRPDLAALAERIKAEQASLGLAHLDFYPDFEVLAAFDSFWQEKPLRAQFGVRLNLPVRKDRRYGAVAEAEARVYQRLAELARQVDQVSYQVQQAYEQVRESEQVVRLYQGRILPAARENVEAAQSAYTTGRIPFLSLVEAQRNVIGLQDRYYEALADYFRRRATLERVVGGPLSPAPHPAGQAAPEEPAPEKLPPPKKLPEEPPDDEPGRPDEPAGRAR